VGKRKPANARHRAYYIRRKSQREGDESLFFCDKVGHRIRFDKVSHCAFILSSFMPEQKAQVVCLQTGDEDRPYADWLPEVLPAHLSPSEYLAAVEKTVQDRRAGREPSRRELNALRRFYRRY
jgi:hypothetical protein